MARKPPTPYLSKSRFMAGLQCHKRLWLELFQPKLAPEVDEATQARFDEGTRVGEVARKYVPGGTLVAESREELTAALGRTSSLLADHEVPAIYEATIRHDNVLVRADILARAQGNSFELLEVKSSTKLKDEHLWDVAVQAHVVRGAGVNLRRVGVLDLNNAYNYQGGEYDPRGLFTLADVTDELEHILPQVPALLAGMRTALSSGSPPAIDPGDHCRKPYDCPFSSHCIAPMNPYSVGELYRLGKRMSGQLAADGITMISDIPSGYGLSAIQNRQRDAIGCGQLVADENLRAELGKLAQPLHFLDFETIYPALPRFAGTRPYQHVPFQWSLHIKERNGIVRHVEYLHDGTDDPRPRLTAALIKALGAEGAVCTFSPYEALRIRDLQEALPAHAAALEQINTRIVDILPIIRNHCYHPDFHGSFSMKSILPALLPELAYDDLAVTDGTSASLVYLELISGSMAEEESRVARKDLLAYCARDTEGLMALVHALLGQKELVGS